jgi:hypothetical protein
MKIIKKEKSKVYAFKEKPSVIKEIREKLAMPQYKISLSEFIRISIDRSLRDIEQELSTDKINK